jgi:hypothetical protein
VQKVLGIYFLEYGGQVSGGESVKRWSEQLNDTESVMLKRNLSRPSVVTDSPAIFVNFLSATLGIAIRHVGREHQIL